MTIRNAREEDFVSCVLIAKRAWPEFQERNSIYHLFCKFFSNTCFVAEEDGKFLAFLLGFISQVNHLESYIHLVAVDPSAQRRGLASSLYHRFFEVVTGLGAQKVRLIVNPDNNESLLFHEKLGFKLDLHGDIVEISGVSAVKDYNGPGIHMVPFLRPLGAVNRK
jgi:ribosomal protein S18 acetylase RimI-like enzyme